MAIRDSVVLTSLVRLDDRYNFRWLDAWGDIVKFFIGAGEPSDDTTNSPDSVIATQVGTSPLTIAQTAGDALLFTTGGTEYDGLNVQARGEAFKCTAAKPWFFGVKFKVSDATQSDVLVGLCELKTDILKASSSHGINSAVEGAFVFKPDAGTTMTAYSYEAGASIASGAYGTALSTDYITVEIYWDGTYLKFYIDNNLVLTTTAAPDGDLTPTVCIRAGAAAAKTLTLAWLRTIQVNS